MLCSIQPAISYKVTGFGSKVVDRVEMARRFLDSSTPQYRGPHFYRRCRRPRDADESRLGRSALGYINNQR